MPEAQPALQSLVIERDRSDSDYPSPVPYPRFCGVVIERDRSDSDYPSPVPYPRFCGLVIEAMPDPAATCPVASGAPFDGGISG